MTSKKLLKAALILGTEISVAILGIIAYLSVLLHLSRNFLHDFDTAITSWIYAFRSEHLTAVMQFITFLGGEIFIISGIILFTLFLYQKHKKSAFNFFFVLVVGTIINLLLKVIYQRPRPDLMPLVYEPTYSFPSGHAMNSFIFYSCVTYFIIRNIKSKRIRAVTIAAFSVLIALIGISRIYLGAHYPSDVIAGFAAGMLWFVFVILMGKTANTLRLFKKKA